LVQPWQDRFRDPSLTVLLVLEICTIFLAVPLAAKGLPTAQLVADTLVLAVIAIVVMLSLRWSAIILILPGLAAVIGSYVVSAEASPTSVIMLRRGGDILMFSARLGSWRTRSMRPDGLRFVGCKAPL
jgi:ABC-type transport system involved in multi-copper enzyme maturation permease subunit